MVLSDAGDGERIIMIMIMMMIKVMMLMMIMIIGVDGDECHLIWVNCFLSSLKEKSKKKMEKNVDPYKVYEHLQLGLEEVRIYSKNLFKCGMQHCLIK